MAATKKTAAVTTAAKVEQPKTEVKIAETPATEVKPEVKAEAVKEAEKKAVKRTPAKTAVKKAAASRKTPVKKAAVKKEEAPKTTRTYTKRAVVKTEIEIQFADENYSQEKLIQIAKDCWAYDLAKKPEELKSVSLYVKPEERAVYVVYNEEIEHRFSI